MKKSWFLPQTPDVLATLRRQAATTLEGMTAFAAWSAGAADKAHAVRDSEHAADVVRRELQGELRAAFSVPLDAEDLYELSERLDAVLNGAKNAVREAEVMEMAPDSFMARMAEEILGGTAHLGESLSQLTANPDRAITEADSAIGCQRDLEHTYRAAMAGAGRSSDVRELFGRRELYRRYARMGDDVVEVAERVWYTLVKHR